MGLLGESCLANDQIRDNKWIDGWTKKFKRQFSVFTIKKNFPVV